MEMIKSSRLKKFIFINLAVFALLIAALALTIALGGPKPIVAMESINTPFKNIDNSALPPAKRYNARDGAALAYRHYSAGYSASYSAGNSAGNSSNPAAAETLKNRRIVLIHGSSANSRSMHTMAQALSKAGFVVDALDMRGHGDSGVRGHIGYIGQLEDDVADFLSAVPHNGANTLIGFSSGGGFVLRFSASAQAALFDRYLLLAPFLIQAPTNRPNPNSGGWASVGIPRIVALTIFNRFGITQWNDLPVTQFALNDEAKKFLTPSYSYALATNFGVHLDYAQDIAKASQNLKVIVGADDELIFAERYADVFLKAGKTISITIVPNINHIGLTLNEPALTMIVAAAGN